MIMIVPFVSRTAQSLRHPVPPGSLLVAVCMIILLLCGCDGQDKVGIREHRPALSVELTSPRTTVWPVEVAASGRVEPWQESVISSEAGGYKLDEVFANVGDMVKKGQLLARFNDETARSRLDEMTADVEIREAVLAASRDLMERSFRLVSSRAVSEESHRQNEIAVTRDEAELSSARARLATQQLELRHTRVVAPDDGVISSRTATVGTVSGSGTELFRLIRQNRLEWRAEIPVNHLACVETGQIATVEVRTGAIIQGTVRQFAPTVDNRTLTAICHVDLPDPGTVKAGMFLSGLIRTGESPALLVPESSIVYRDGRTHVIRVGVDSLARQIPVTTARRGGDLVEIAGEISAEDRLVLSGGSFIHEGDLVKVIGGDRVGNKGGDR